MRTMLVTFGIAAFAALAGAGQARANGIVYPQQSEAQQQGAKAPAVVVLPEAAVPGRQDEMPPESTLQTGRLLKMIAPVYPPAAIRAHISGTVVVDARIAADGRVVSVNAVRGPQALRRVAERAIRHWRYEPSLLDGKPVEREAQVDLRFILGNH